MGLNIETVIVWQLLPYWRQVELTLLSAWLKPMP